ncbi:hypothetical protein MFIFM68171_03169 [Madurella fahalii]|uniref:Uncharacterized protein n=1 Tax=Madurella fahalii TaxID=1157608 RepID=A0ABQ0G5M7_9PEZI
MGSNVDTNDIMGFLQGYRNGEPDHGQGSYYGHNDPRWAPPVTNANLLSTSGYYSDFDAAHTDRQSEYTTASTVTSQTYTTTMRSNASPSVFSAHTGWGDGSVAQSSAPSVGHARQTFVQQFADGPAPGGARHDYLWCEFSELLNCPVTFRLDDERRWIAHHAEHLKDSYPQTLMCWFCDHVPFVAANSNDTAANFEERMLHIREHIFSDRYPLTSRDVRPDFHVVKHLHRLRVISDAMYKHAMAYDETPRSYRLPGTTSSSTRPLGQPSSVPPRNREVGEYYDLDKERRRNRERNRGRERQNGEANRVRRGR